MRSNKITLAPLALSVAAVLSGCAIQPIEGPDYDQTRASAQTQIQSLPQPVPARKGMNVRENHPWVSIRSINAKSIVPNELMTKQVTLNEPNPVPVESLQNKIERIISVPLRIDHDVLNPRTTASAGGMGQPTTPIQGLLGQMNSAQGVGGPQDYGLMHLMGSASNPEGMIQGGGQDTRVSLSYKGTAKGLLDAFTVAMKAHWRYDAPSHSVVIYRYETKTFRVAALPGSAASNTTVSVQGSSGGGSTSATFQGQMSIWNGITNDIDNLKSKEGSVSISEATGILTVTDLPEAVERIGAYIDRINKGLQREVTVDVKIYKVAATDLDRRGLNLEGAFQSVGLNASLNTPRGDVTGLSSLTLSVPDSVLGGGQHLIGSKLLVDSLNRLGRTTTMIDTAVRTVNNQPAPIRSGRKVAYLKESTRSDSTYGTTVSLTPGEVDVGFNMQVLPSVQDNGSDVLLQVSMTLSNLDAMQVFSAAGSSIQLPEISSRDFMQRVWMRSGESLVLASINQQEDSTTNSGTIHGNVWPLGGTRESKQVEDLLVIVITPVVGGV